MIRAIIFLILFVLSNPICWAVEVAPRITDREIIERLTRIEEGQRAILREMDKRFESIDKRFESMDKRFESIDKRFDQLINIFIGITVAFAGIVAVTIGFAIWDRRSMIRPFETKVKEIESQIEDIKIKVKDFDQDKLVRLVGAMRRFAEGNKEIADILKSFNLL